MELARPARRRTAAVALATLAALSLAGCSSEKSGSGPTTAPPSAELVGTWTADAGQLLDQTLANVGAPAGLTCSGPISTTFASGGTFTRTGDITCATGPLSFSGTIDTTGSWSADATQLTISGAQVKGTTQLPGKEIPTPDGFGDGVADYELSGDTLTVTFSGQSVGTVTQTYTRAG